MILALACALVAGFAGYRFLAASAPSVPVVVAAVDLQPGERVDEQDLKIVNLPELAVPKDAVLGEKELQDMLGRHAQTYIAAGDPIRKRHFAETRAGGTAAARLMLAGKELKGFALPPEANKGLAVEIGDRVDVIGILKPSGSTQGQVEYIAKGAPVIDVSGGRDEKTGMSSDVVVTVGLTEEQAGKAAYYKDEGSLTIVLRAPGER